MAEDPDMSSPEGSLSSSSSPQFLSLPAPQKRTLQMKMDEPIKSGSAEGTQLKEKRRKCGMEKDDEIALYKLKSAEALAGMKQVKNMISRFEQTQVSGPTKNEKPPPKSSYKQVEKNMDESSNVIQTIGDSQSNNDHEKGTEKENKPKNQNNELTNEEKKPHSEGNTLTDVWEKVLRPVRQRVVEIERVLSDTSRPGDLPDDDAGDADHSLKPANGEETADNIVNELGACAMTDKQGMEALPTRLCAKPKSHKLSVNLHPAEGREVNVDTEMCRFNGQFEDMVKKYKVAFIKEQEKNQILVSDLEIAQEHTKQIQEEFNERLEKIEDELSIEKVKNDSLQQELENVKVASDEKAREQSKLVHEEFNKQLEKVESELSNEKVKSANLEQELEKHRVLSCDWEKAQEQCKILDKEYKERLQSIRDELAKETQANACLQQELERQEVVSTDLENVWEDNKTLREELDERFQRLEDELSQEKLTNASLQQELDSYKTMSSEVEKAHVESKMKEEEYIGRLEKTEGRLSIEKATNVNLQRDLEKLKMLLHDLEKAQDQSRVMEKECDVQLSRMQDELSTEKTASISLKKELEKYRTLSSVLEIARNDSDMMEKELIERLQKQEDELSNKQLEIASLEQDLEMQKMLYSDLERAQNDNKNIQEEIVEQLQRTKDELSREKLQNSNLHEELRKKTLLSSDFEMAQENLLKIQDDSREKSEKFEGELAKEKHENEGLKQELEMLKILYGDLELAQSNNKEKQEEIVEQLQRTRDELLREKLQNSNLHEELKKKTVLSSNFKMAQENLLKIQDECREKVEKIEGELAREKETSSNLKQKLDQHDILSSDLEQVQNVNKAIQEELGGQLLRMEEEFSKEKSLNANLQQELDNYRMITSELEIIRDNLKTTQAQLREQVQRLEGELSKEKLKNSSLQQDLKRSTEEHASTISEIKALKQKLKTSEQQLQEGQVRNGQLECEIGELKQGTSDQMMLTQKLQYAEEVSNEKQRLNLQLLHEMAKAREQFERKIKLMKQDFEEQLQVSHRKLQEEQKNIHKLQDMHSDVMTAAHWKHQSEELRQECHTLKGMYEEERSKNVKMQDKLGEQRAMKHRLSALDAMLQQECTNYAALEEEKNAACDRLSEVEDELQRRQQEYELMVSEEQQKNAALEAELLEMKQTAASTMKLTEEDNREQIKDLEDKLAAELAENQMLQEKQNQALVEMLDVEKDLKSKVEAYHEELEEARLKINNMEDELCSLDKCKTVSDEKYRCKIQALQTILEQEKKKSDKLKTENDKCVTEMKKVKEKLKKQECIWEKKLGDEKLKKNALENELQSVKEVMSKAQSQEEERNLEVEKLKQTLEEQQLVQDVMSKAQSQEEERSLEVEKLKQTLEEQQKLELQLQVDKEDAFSQMEHMEKELHKRLDAFKEVYCEDQIKVSMLESEIRNCRKEHKARNEKTRRELYDIKAKNVRLVAEKGRLELEVEKLKRDLEHSLEENLRSTQSLKTLSSVDGKEYSDEDDVKLGENVNNNKTQYQLYHNMLLLQNRLAEQDLSIMDFQHSTQEYLLQQDLKDELCRAYIHELEQIKGLHSNEIERLRNVVKCFEIAFADNQMYGNNKGIQSTLRKGHTVRGTTTSNPVLERRPLDVKIEKLQQQMKINEERANMKYLVAQGKEILATKKRQMPAVNPRSLVDAEGRVSGNSQMVADANDLVLAEKHQNETKVLQTLLARQHKVTANQSEVVRTLLNQMQGVEGPRVPDNAMDVQSSPFDRGFSGQQQPSNATLVDMFSQLLKMSAKSAEENDKLVAAASRMMETVSELKADNESQKEIIKEYDSKTQLLTQDYKQRLIEVDRHHEGKKQEYESKIRHMTQEYKQRLIGIDKHHDKKKEEFENKLQSLRHDYDEKLKKAEKNLVKKKEEFDRKLQQLKDDYDERLGEAYDSQEEKHQEYDNKIRQLRKELSDQSLKEVEKHDQSSQQYEHKIQQLKSEYETKLRALRDKLQVAGETEALHASEVARLKDQVEETKKTVQSLAHKEAEALLSMAEDREQELQGKIRDQKYALDSSTREKKDLKSKVEELRYQLQVKGDQLRDKCSALEEANEAAAGLRLENERERHDAQRKLIRHNASLQERDAELRQAKAKAQEFKDEIDQLQEERALVTKLHKGDLEAVKKEHDEARSENRIEIKLLRHQIEKAESRIKDMETKKDREIQRLTSKQEMTREHLSRLQDEHVECLEECRRKVSSMQKVNTQGTIVRGNQLTGLDRSSSHVLKQVETMLRRMQTIEELLMADDQAAGFRLRYPF